MSSIDLALSTILSPMVLFFVLGLGAALLRSQMTVPEAFSKGLAIYLMMAIGFKGGVEMSQTPLDMELLSIVGLSLVLSFGLPFIAYNYLRRLAGMNRIDAAATAGHYGSISIVTFVAATEALKISGMDVPGHMVAMAALMETPAIISALWIGQRGMKKESAVVGAESGELMREVFLNASVVVLLGAMAIGWTTGADGMTRVEPFFVAPFQGVLCIFLLDMGLNAGRGLRTGWRALNFATLTFGIIMPLIGAMLALLGAKLAGLDLSDAILLMVLGASASYIAVPAAMRLALPQAKPSIYLTLSLGITFPFNLVVGIPIYIAAAQIVIG